MDRKMAVAAILVSVLASCATSSHVDVPLVATNGSGVSGRALLGAAGSATTATVALAGLRGGETYRVTLQGGSCDRPSASFSQIADLIADKDGRASTDARVRFRDADMDLGTVADGSRVIAVQLLGTGTVACGPIPALQR